MLDSGEELQALVAFKHSSGKFVIDVGSGLGVIWNNDGLSIHASARMPKERKDFVFRILALSLAVQLKDF
jgi:hypothetical protein